MKEELSFWIGEIRAAILGEDSLASDVIVQWTELAGGTLDPGTGATIGGTETLLSGTVRAYGYEEAARNVVRQFAEIQTGDLILDFAPDPEVALYPGQMSSGTVALDTLANKGLTFYWNERPYVSKEVSPDLQAVWDAYAGNRRLCRTLLLRKAT